MLPKRMVFRNFRSIGSDGFVLDNINRVNIVLGKNNAGKSNVIRAIQFIKKVVQKHNTLGSVKMDPLDYHLRDAKNRFSCEVSIDIPEDTLLSGLEKKYGSLTFKFEVDERAEMVACSYMLGDAADTSQNIQELYQDVERWYIANVNHYSERSSAIKIWNQRVSEGYFEVLSRCIADIQVIPEFRRISHGETYTISGERLIETLAVYRDPPVGEENQKIKFQKIGRFVKELLLLDQSAQLSITRDDSTIIIENNGMRLPLSSYGTGVHQIVVLLTALIGRENCVFCIEEPEIHLYPQLQKEFVRFLIDETSNRYIITTHSPTLINLKGNSDRTIGNSLATYYIRSLDGSATGGEIIKSSDALDALNEMGTSASDILQSNCLIWVEGPSDRIYVRRWIELTDPSLKEGVDFQFVYVGGSVISSFEFRDDAEIGDLINVLTINRRSAIVIDSDRRSPGAHLKPNVKRIKDECERLGILCWITAGKEIENYVSPRAILESSGISDQPMTFERFQLIDDAIKNFNARKKGEAASLWKQ